MLNMLADAKYAALRMPMPLVSMPALDCCAELPLPMLGIAAASCCRCLPKLMLPLLLTLSMLLLALPIKSMKYFVS
jgi:hypothetical protein